jgi:hypothetical protein
MAAKGNQVAIEQPSAGNFDDGTCLSFQTKGNRKTSSKRTPTSVDAIHLLRHEATNKAANIRPVYQNLLAGKRID